MKLFILLILGFMNGAFAADGIICEPRLPQENPYNLPATWSMEVSPERDLARLVYPEQERGVLTTNVISGVIPSDDFTSGYSIGRFGYSVNGHTMHIVIAYKKSISDAIVQFRAKVSHGRRGTTVLVQVPGNCRTF
jgi:hypothetical protein